jgi:hypothetical protein
MQVGSIAASLPKNQSALKLITDIVESGKGDQSRRPDGRKVWSSETTASTVSSRSASAIQDLVQGKASGTTTFKVLGGGERSVPTDEYEFAARTTFQTVEEVAADFVATQVETYEAALKQVQSIGWTEQAEFLTSQIDSLKKSLANGTVKVELLDDRVSGNDYDYTGMRDSEGNVGGLRGVNVKPLDWDAFNKVYGDGQGGYDRNYLVGGNYFIRGYVISWEK